MGIKLTKKSNLRGVKALAKGAKATPGDFVLQDNGDDTFTVLGVDAAGNPVDISGVATITASSSDTSILTVDVPSAMTFGGHATGKLSTPGAPVIISVTATWNDGSIGPFTATLPVDVIAGPAGGIQIVPGVPTSH